MKKYILSLIVLTGLLSSCSIEDSNPINYHLEVLPINTVTIPEEFVHGMTYEISVTYTRPSTCYQFNDFIYEINGNERTVAVVNTVYQAGNSSCVEDPEEVTASFNFIVTATETYVFKFYQGEDADGVDQYYIVEVPVALERPTIDLKGELN